MLISILKPSQIVFENILIDFKVKMKENKENKENKEINFLQLKILMLNNNELIEEINYLTSKIIQF